MRNNFVHLDKLCLFNGIENLGYHRLVSVISKYVLGFKCKLIIVGPFW